MRVAMSSYERCKIGRRGIRPIAPRPSPPSTSLNPPSFYYLLARTRREASGIRLLMMHHHQLFFLAHDHNIITSSGFPSEVASSS